MSPTYFTGDLWLYQSSMRSHLGHLIQEDSSEAIELAKSLDLISASYGLTEMGNLVKLFLQKRLGEVVRPVPIPNPLIIYDDEALRLLYLYALIKADIVFAAMLNALSAGTRPADALRVGLDHIIGKSESQLRLDEIASMQPIFELRRRIDKIPVEKAQRVPRLEFCVDLGLLDRTSDTSDEEDGRYKITAYLQQFKPAFSSLIERPTTAPEWLDKHFFDASSILYGKSLAPINDSELRLYYFVKGCTFLGRRVGFIPGRIAGISACILAWIDGLRLELHDVFDEVYQAPKGRWKDHINFSGGSRLDREFFVSIDKTLEAELKQAVRNKPSA
jgi:hypothetical protein